MSIPLHSHQMVSASSQARTMEQFVCGMPRLERQRRARLLDTRIGSFLWHSRQMASASSQALTIEQFVCGTPRPEKQRQAHLPDTQIWSSLWHSRQMASCYVTVGTFARLEQRSLVRLTKQKDWSHVVSEC